MLSCSMRNYASLQLGYFISKAWMTMKNTSLALTYLNFHIIMIQELLKPREVNSGYPLTLVNKKKH